MTNKEKALALIGTFVTGDLEKAKSLLAEEYKQHNLAFGTGREAFIAAVDGLQKAPVKTTVNNIRAFEDGDRVFLQTVYNFAGAGEQVAFDIFRFDADGKIAEHWDNLAAKAEPNPSGHTQIDGYDSLENLDKTEENREIIKNFLVDVMQGKHPEKTPDYFDGDTYIQHNIGIADGLSGLGAALIFNVFKDEDNLDYEDKHYKRRKADLEDRLSKTYDKIEETENALVEAKAKKRSILAEKVCGDNIYKALIFFDKMYEPMNEAERREFLTQFIEKVEIYEEEQENGQWLKSIEFKLPIISKDMKISLDNGSQIETVILLSLAEC